MKFQPKKRFGKTMILKFNHYDLAIWEIFHYEIFEKALSNKLTIKFYNWIQEKIQNNKVNSSFWEVCFEVVLNFKLLTLGVKSYHTISPNIIAVENSKLLYLLLVSRFLSVCRVICYELQFNP
jgi:hypothetical protein